MTSKIYSTESVSPKFVIFVLIMLSVIAAYIFYPSNKEDSDITYVDGIAYSVSPKEEQGALENSYIENSGNEEQNTNDITQYSEQENQNEQSEEIQNPVQDNASEVQREGNQEQVNNDNIKVNTYESLLDELAQYPSKSEYALKTIINRILVYKGYPSNTLRISVFDIDQSRIKSRNDYMFANFDLMTGDLNISKKLLYELDIEAVIAILMHELDHFDKAAQICKSIGIEDFGKIFIDNGGVNFNKDFWRNASFFANIDNFDSELYTGALKRFITQKSVGIQSPYSDFYVLSENMRNPLEISAYKESDDVFNYFKIPIVEGDLKKITSVFNKIDWAIYNSSQNLPVLQQERVAVFDYFFAKAIVQVFPEFKNELQTCDIQKSGDLTSFWTLFKNKFDGFYSQGKMTEKTMSGIMSVLNETEKIAKQGIAPEEIEKALRFRMNTLKENLVSQESVESLKKTTLNYLKYLKQTNISDKKQELNAILLLICINNKLYTNNSDKISLHNIKMPYELMELYDTENDRSKFIFIYKNETFKETDLQMKDSDKLIYLINSLRLKPKS